jgi:hypothetical protein
MIINLNPPEGQTYDEWEDQQVTIVASSISIPYIGTNPVEPPRPADYDPDATWSWGGTIGGFTQPGIWVDGVWYEPVVIAPIWWEGGWVVPTWSEETWEDGTWEYSLRLTAIGGGRYKIKTLAFGKDGGTGVIYVGD